MPCKFNLVLSLWNMHQIHASAPFEWKIHLTGIASHYVKDFPKEQNQLECSTFLWLLNLRSKRQPGLLVSKNCKEQSFVLAFTRNQDFVSLFLCQLFLLTRTTYWEWFSPGFHRFVPLPRSFYWHWEHVLIKSMLFCTLFKCGVVYTLNI